MATINDIPDGPITPANSLQKWNELVDAFNALQRDVYERFEDGNNSVGGRPAALDIFLGYTVTSPPNSSPGNTTKYDDARYYVMRGIAPSPSSTDKPTYDPQGSLTDEISLDDDPFNGHLPIPQYVTATNLAELSSDYGLGDDNGADPGTHTLADDTIVLVMGFPSRQNPARRTYVFFAMPPICFPVKVKKDGGVAGSMATSTSCNFTYTLYDENENAIENATGLTPDITRFSNCKYDTPADNSPGIAYYDASGTIHLYSVAQEKPTGATYTAYEDSIDGSGNLVKTGTPLLVLDKGDAESPVTIATACP